MKAAFITGFFAILAAVVGALVGRETMEFNINIDGDTQTIRPKFDLVIKLEHPTATYTFTNLEAN